MREDIVSSIYTGLINSNISIKGKDPNNSERIKKFIEGVKRLFLSANVLNMIEILDPEDAKIPKERLIERIEIFATIEVGGEIGCVHVHYRIRILHWTTLKFVSNRTMDFFKHFYNMSIYPSSAKLGFDTQIGWVRYLHKNKPRANRLSIISNVDGFDALPWMNEEPIQNYSVVI